jgi:hypothetical protein
VCISQQPPQVQPWPLCKASQHPAPHRPALSRALRPHPNCPSAAQPQGPSRRNLWRPRPCRDFWDHDHQFLQPAMPAIAGTFTGMMGVGLGQRFQVEVAAGLPADLCHKSMESDTTAEVALVSRLSQPVVPAHAVALRSVCLWSGFCTVAACALPGLARCAINFETHTRGQLQQRLEVARLAD